MNEECSAKKGSIAEGEISLELTFVQTDGLEILIPFEDAVTERRLKI